MRIVYTIMIFLMSVALTGCTMESKYSLATGGRIDVPDLNGAWSCGSEGSGAKPIVYTLKGLGSRYMISGENGNDVSFEVFLNPRSKTYFAQMRQVNRQGSYTIIMIQFLTSKEAYVLYAPDRDGFLRSTKNRFISGILEEIGVETKPAIQFDMSDGQYGKVTITSEPERVRRWLSKIDQSVFKSDARMLCKKW